MSIYLQRSRVLLGDLIASHAFAMTMVIMSSLHWSLTLGLLLLISLNLLYHARRYGWLMDGPATAILKLSGDQRWQLIDSQGRPQGEYQLRRSVMLGCVLVIYLKKPFSRLSHSVLIARDAVEPEQWRLLRVKLRDPGQWV